MSGENLNTKDTKYTKQNPREVRGVKGKEEVRSEQCRGEWPLRDEG
jgi:hypothetical protein